MSTKDLEITKPTKIPSKKKRRLFIEFWLSDPGADTFGNAYLSAKEAGFSESYARVITGEALGLDWVKEAKDLYAAAMSPAHIYKGVQDIALNTRSDRDKLNAYTQLGKWNGMEVSRSVNEHKVTFTNSVPRPVIDLTQSREDEPDSAPILDS